MEIVSLIISVALIVLLIWGILAKRNIPTLLLVLTLVAYLAATIISGTTFYTTKSTGNMFFDVIEMWPASLASTLTGTGLIILIVMPFSALMEKIGASQKFAAFFTKILGGIKAKSVLVALGTLIAMIIMLVIPSAMSAFVVLLSTIYPVLVAAGVNPLTALVALFLGVNICAGPANPFVLMMNTGVGLDLSAADFFIQYSLLPIVCTMVVVSIVHAIWARHCEKKEEERGEIVEADAYSAEVEQVECPGWYGLFVLLPLVIIIVFSSLTGLGIIASVTGSYVFVSLLALLVEVLRQKDKGAAFDSYKIYFTAMGQSLTSPVLVVALGTFFGAGLVALGGLTWLINLMMSSLGLGFWGLLFLLLLAHFFLAMFGGPPVAIGVTAPIIGAVAVSTGCTELLPLAAFILCFGGGFGLSCCPFDPKVLFISDLVHVDAMRVVKRLSVPAIAGVVAAVVFGLLFLGA